MNIQKYIKSPEFFDSFSAFVKLVIIFLIGIGNYRSVLFLCVFYCAKSFIDYEQKHDFLKFLFLPPFLYLVYLDLKLGQLWFNRSNNLLIFAITLLIVDLLSTKYIYILAEKLINNYVFSYCVNCRHENSKFVTRCNNCGYEKNSVLNMKKNDSKLYDDTFLFQLPFLKNILKTDYVNDLCLGDNECIYMSIKINFGNSPYIDGHKKLFKSIVVTNKRIIFFNKLHFQRGWNFREEIPLKSIEKILAENKKIGNSTRQTIKLCAGIRTFEIFLWSINKEEKTFNKYFDAINMNIKKIQELDMEKSE